ncbi:MAG: hypothetical protein QNL87_10940 [Gammaproteobacteria bacterium]|nr:hypothetical protein [Gammaproteobacteria bacterium]
MPTCFRQIHVRSGKGDKERLTILADQLNKTHQLHQCDLHEGFGETRLPCALSKKGPNAGREWGWQSAG